jgi:hypothetical protein
MIWKSFSSCAYNYLCTLSGANLGVLLNFFFSSCIESIHFHKTHRLIMSWWFYLEPTIWNQIRWEFQDSYSTYRRIIRLRINSSLAPGILFSWMYPVYVLSVIFCHTHQSFHGIIGIFEKFLNLKSFDIISSENWLSNQRLHLL